jgi:diguanylate cyclase (GGDEF)-like protein
MSGTVTTTEVRPATSSVAAARALLPRVWAGEDVRVALQELLDAARAADDIPGECAALYSEMAAASIAADRERGRAAAELTAQRGAEGGYPAWESTGRQYVARLALADGNEDVALARIVEAELLVDGLAASVELAVALNGIAVTYSRLGLFEDADRIHERLGEVTGRVDDDWAEQAFVHNRMLNQAAWALSLIRVGERDAAHDRLRIAAAQARDAVDMSRSQARFDFNAMCLFTDVMIGDVQVEAGRAALERMSADINTEPRSFVRFALAHGLANAGRMEQARTEVAAGLAAVNPLEGEPVYSMLLWERARIATTEDPDHPGLRDTWAYAKLTTEQVWELRRRRVEAARDRLRIGRLRRDHERVERALLEDPLTGAANRRRIDADRAEMLTWRPGTWASVLYIDIDDFKTVNDTHGHELGDAVLRELSALLFEHTRDRDVVGRYGGDEFVVLARYCDPDDARLLSERILAAVRFHRWEDLLPGLRIRVSIGVASGRQDYDELFPAADVALYEAKRGGRDRAMVRQLSTDEVDAEVGVGAAADTGLSA